MTCKKNKRLREVTDSGFDHLTRSLNLRCQMRENAEETGGCWELLNGCVWLDPWSLHSLFSWRPQRRTEAATNRSPFPRCNTSDELHPLAAEWEGRRQQVKIYNDVAATGTWPPLHVRAERDLKNLWCFGGKGIFESSLCPTTGLDSTWLSIYSFTLSAWFVCESEGPLSIHCFQSL